MPNEKINVKKSNGVIVVELLDEQILDELLIDRITTDIFDVIEKNKPVNMLLSFANVRYLSSSMLGVLIRLSKRATESGGTLKLCCIKPSLYEMFVITKLTRLFDIYDNEPLGLAGFNA